jgi:hypothetical protein
MSTSTDLLSFLLQPNSVIAGSSSDPDVSSSVPFEQITDNALFWFTNLNGLITLSVYGNCSSSSQDSLNPGCCSSNLDTFLVPLSCLEAYLNFYSRSLASYGEGQTSESGYLTTGIINADGSFSVSNSSLSTNFSVNGNQITPLTFSSPIDLYEWLTSFPENGVIIGSPITSGSCATYATNPSLNPLIQAYATAPLAYVFNSPTTTDSTLNPFNLAPSQYVTLIQNGAPSSSPVSFANLEASLKLLCSSGVFNSTTSVTLTNFAFPSVIQQFPLGSAIVNGASVC